MKKRYGIGLFLLMVALFLFGCSEQGSETKHQGTKNQVSNLVTEKTIVLKTEGKLIYNRNDDDYVFNGFIGKDTLSFQQEIYWYQNSGYNYDIYQPAVIGHTFSFKNIDAKIEIIDFNRKKGTVTLKLTKK